MRANLMIITAPGGGRSIIMIIIGIRCINVSCETSEDLKLSPGDCFNKEWGRFFMADRRSAKFSNKFFDELEGVEGKCSQKISLYINCIIC